MLFSYISRPIPEITQSILKDTFPLTHKLPRIQAEKIMKYENLTPEIKNIWKLNYVSIQFLVISAKGVVTRTL